MVMMRDVFLMRGARTVAVYRELQVESLSLHRADTYFGMADVRIPCHLPM